MKAKILYHPESDHARMVTDYARDFERQVGRPLELISLETPAGSDLAQLHDVTQYPAILATDDEGKLLQMWQGEKFPMIREVGYYQSGHSRP